MSKDDQQTLQELTIEQLFINYRACKGRGSLVNNRQQSLILELSKKYLAEIKRRDIEYAWVREIENWFHFVKAPVIKKTSKQIHILLVHRNFYYRLDRKKFELGEHQTRDGWIISQWDADAAKLCDRMRRNRED